MSIGFAAVEHYNNIIYYVCCVSCAAVAIEHIVRAARVDDWKSR